MSFFYFLSTTFGFAEIFVMFVNRVLSNNSKSFLCFYVACSDISFQNQITRFIGDGFVVPPFESWHSDPIYIDEEDSCAFGNHHHSLVKNLQLFKN